MNDDVNPKYITRLFEIKKKSELEKYSRTITIILKDFVSLIDNCDTIGYIHKRRTKIITPQHHMLTKTDKKALGHTNVEQTLQCDAKKQNG